MKTKDKQGLYFQGEFKTSNYTDSIKEIFQLNEIPNGFCVNANYEANGYSIIDSNGIQHVYELNPTRFYDELMK